MLLLQRPVGDRFRDRFALGAELRPGPGLVLLHELADAKHGVGLGQPFDVLLTRVLQGELLEALARPGASFELRLHGLGRHGLVPGARLLGNLLAQVRPRLVEVGTEGHLRILRRPIGLLDLHVRLVGVMEALDVLLPDVLRQTLATETGLGVFQRLRDDRRAGPDRFHGLQLPLVRVEKELADHLLVRIRLGPLVLDGIARLGRHRATHPLEEPFELVDDRFLGHASIEADEGRTAQLAHVLEGLLRPVVHLDLRHVLIRHNVVTDNDRDSLRVEPLEGHGIILPRFEGGQPPPVALCDEELVATDDDGQWLLDAVPLDCGGERSDVQVRGAPRVLLDDQAVE